MLNNPTTGYHNPTIKLDESQNITQKEKANVLLPVQ
jgi:hypothetical protein